MVRPSRVQYSDMPVREMFHRRRALLVRQAEKDARIPARTDEWNAGYDLFALEDVTVPQLGQDPATVRTGVVLALPLGHVGLIVPKPSTAVQGIMILLPVIEPNERCEVIIPVISVGRSYRRIYAHEAFAELIVVPYSMAGSRRVDVLPPPGETR